MQDSNLNNFIPQISLSGINIEKVKIFQKIHKVIASDILRPEGTT